jgi:UDP-N-acetylmuramoyl-tripeptide--D-alanyl-D-alanine ligase
MTLAEVARAANGTLHDSGGDVRATSVSTDTRTLQPGALFVALRGERHDGHDHMVAARERGAVGLLVERDVAGVHLPSVVVGDTLVAYGDLARAYRDGFGGPVVGVTGSVGKTTAKEMIAHVLACTFSVHKSAANHNNEVGLPQTIFAAPDATSVLVLEMGMRGAGEIARLAEIARPTVGVVTNIGLSHVERLGSPEAIADAKGELLEALPADGGCAVLPADDAFLPRLRARFAGETLTCGIDVPADVAATELVRHENGWRFTTETPWGRTKGFVPTPGRFNVQNALFALAVGGRLGVPLASMARALRTWTPPAMRLETVTAANGALVFSDVYNAAPQSMVGALETLRDTKATGKRVAVLGEMRELGAFAEQGHALVGRAVAETKPDQLVLVGPLTDALAAAAREAGFPADAVTRCADADEAARVAAGLVGRGDVVLVKGSRALAMERVVQALTAGGGA